MRGRKRPTLPDGATVILAILEAEVVSGQYGPQLRLKLKVVSGKYRGFEFYDWSKLSKDPQTGEVYYDLGTKVEEIYSAAFGDEYSFEDDHEPRELVSRRIMSRVGLAGKNEDRNRLEYGSIGPDPNADDEDAT